jgi:hypothetical protein
MERGLLWLPLLVMFFWLAWAGWNEYQKLEVYREWASQFQRAKYDLYSVLGEKEGELTWGKATRKGIVDLKMFSLKDVKAIRLLIDDQVVDLQAPPDRGRSTSLEFELPNSSAKIPFTQVSLAAKWGQVLQDDWRKMQQ